MDPDAIKVWLKKKKCSGVALNSLLALVAALAGIVVLFLTFWLTYAVVWFGWEGVSALSDLVFGRQLQLSHGARLACSGVFVALLFIQQFRTNPRYWGEYPKRDYVAAPGLQAQAGVLGGLVFMLAYPRASANMVADVLLSGPRLVMGAWGLVAKVVRLKRLDETGCAELLTFLFGRAGAVTYEELKSAGWEGWLPQLRCIEGITFLQHGLSLSGDLRDELNHLGPV